MFNLLRMDLYRLRKGKAVYILIGTLMAAVALVFLLLFLMLTPQGQAIAGKLGMIDAMDVQDAKEAFRDINLLLVFRQSFLDGGFFAVVMTIFFTLFVCDDFKNGFVKNILSVHVNRWNYIGSKMLAFAIIDLIYLAVLYLFTLLLNLLFGGRIPYTDFSSVFIYLAQAWVLTVAMLGLVLMVCMITRSIAAGILTSILAGSGLIVTILNTVLGFFGANKWLSYTLYMRLRDASAAFHQPAYVTGLIVGIIFLIVYTVMAGITLKKKDI